MPFFAELVERLFQFEELYREVTFVQLLAFLEITRRMRPLLDLAQPRRGRSTLPPLPDNVAHVLSMGTDLPPSRVTQLWLAIGPVLLEDDAMTVSQTAVDHALSTIGPSERLGMTLSLAVEHYSHTGSQAQKP